MTQSRIQQNKVSWRVKLAISSLIAVLYVVFFLSVFAAFYMLSEIYLPKDESASKTAPTIWLIAFTGIASGTMWFANNRSRHLKQISANNLRIPKQNPFTCIQCQKEAPLIETGLNRHFGMIIIFHHTYIKGDLCRNCITELFWKYTPLTLLLGWWGLVSVVLTPIVLVGNCWAFLRSRSMAEAYADRLIPSFETSDVEILAPIRDLIIEDISSGKDLQTIALDRSETANTTPGKLFLYACYLINEDQAAGSSSSSEAS